MSIKIEYAKIAGVIRTIRGCQVILDSDLAALYGVEIKRLNEQVKRNVRRFPDDFMFTRTGEEAEAVKRLRSQFATLKNALKPGGSRGPALPKPRTLNTEH